MTPVRFILASLRHYRRIHVAVALGVAVAAAVLTGALLVGDSMRGSLRDLTIQRLGKIDSVLIAEQLFRAALAEELASEPGFKANFATGTSRLRASFETAEPALLLTGTLQTGSGKGVRRATRVSVVGIRPTFWELGQGGPAKPLADGQVALTESLATELGAQVNDEILLRLGTVGAIPADSPLGEKSETSTARPLEVAAVLPGDGLARFSLAPSQHLPRNVFLPLTTLQKILDQPGKANAILVSSQNANRPNDAWAVGALQGTLRPALEDYGLRIEPLPFRKTAVQISADQLVLRPEVVSAMAEFSRDEIQPVVTYLANSIAIGEGESQRKIPYSTITGIHPTSTLGPLRDEGGEPIVLAEDEIVLNQWAAADLKAKVGDLVSVTYYEPESVHGKLRERKTQPLKLRAIVPLEDAAGNPSPAADSMLTPELPGVTDKESIDEWDLPFELVEKIRPQDEEYWDKYHTTPKAFISPHAAARLWKSRWGTTSLVRIDLSKTLHLTDQSAVEWAESRLREELVPSHMGMRFMPVKAQGLAASQGTTPFDWLFLGFSFFLMASAVMLIAILFQLGVEQRARELGTLAAVGVGRRSITRLLGREGLVVAAIGAALGVAIGILYAWLMITLLRTWWVAAIATPFLELHVTPRSLLVGWVIGVAISWLTILWSTRRLARQPANRLLAGAITTEAEAGAAGRGHGAGRRSALPPWAIARAALALLTITLLALSTRVEGEAQAGVFFATGAMVLVLMLGEIRHRLRWKRARAARQRTFALPALSALNTARNPGRSTLTIGLVAAASFLIVAISAFRLETDDAGTGGFDYLATSDLAVNFDLNTKQGRLKLGFSDADNEALNTCRVYSLRVADGEDASCLNLYRPTQPRVLGVPDEFIERGGFAWSAVHKPDAISDAATEDSSRNPWALLNADLGRAEAGGPIVPVVLDASTAVYSLHLGGVGDRLTIRDAAGAPVTLEVVGLLKNSVLQGNLLVSEQSFLQMFPGTGGNRFFLIENRAGEAPAEPRPATNIGSAGASPSQEIAQILESTLAEEGFDVVDAREQLGQFLAVQNTYLSTFQSLGALGLLLGTVGLAIVQLRSVIERRAELALMRAAGFRSSRLTGMIIWENGVLLFGGLLTGSVAAAVTLLPQSMLHEAGVPWRTLGALLVIIAVVGLLAAWLATRSALRAPILPALRGD